MAKAFARVDWLEKEYFQGTTDKGTKVPMESAPPGIAPRGPTPKELVLHALAGCTLIDVLSIIQKSRKKLAKCWAEVEAEIAETYPKKYTRIHLTYHFVSPDLDAGVAERAIKLSREKYCSVTAMLNVEITCDYEIRKP